LVLSCEKESKLGYKDKTLPIEERIKDLIGKMSLEDKIG
jgi:hypothetical protein